MQRITFHNNQNDLEYSFATDTPRTLLSAFDGNSLGAEFVQFKPIDFDGSKTLSHTLNARTVTFTADWYAVEGGKRSRAAALDEWEKLQWVFSPGDAGVLTWTNGTDIRTIECYANEIPVLHEKTRGLFSADFTLTADYPLWKGSVLHSAVFNGRFTMELVEIENTCPVFVPPLIKIEGGIVSLMRTNRAGKSYPDKTLEIDPSRCSADKAVYIDNEQQLVYQYSPDDTGKKLDRNYSLTPFSDFFSLYPGVNGIVLTMNANVGDAETTVTFNWWDRYLGVSK